MKVTLYKTFLCPRCFLAGRALNKLRSEFPDLTIETVEVTREPLRAWQDGVRILPAVNRDGKTISGLLLTTATLRDFLRS
jgi:predicted DsbA family dithiol-disulfide isomerase